MVKDLPQFEQQVAIQPRELPDVQASKSALTDKLAQFGFGVAQAIRKRSQTELDANKAAAQIQIRDGISHIRQKVLDPNVFSDSASDNFDAQVAGLRKGVLATVDPKNKAAVTNFLSYYGDRNRDVVVSRVQALKKNQKIGGLQEYNTKITDDAVNSKLSGEVIPDPEDKTKSVSKGDFLISQVNQANDDAMNRGLITPKEAFAYKEAAHKSYAEASYASQFQQALAQGHDPDKWLDSLNKNKNVDSATKQKVQLQAYGTVNKIQQSAKTSQNLIQQDAEAAIKQVSQGLDINSPHVSNVRLRADALPGEDRQGIEHRLTAASVFSVAKKEMKFTPFNQSDAILKKMEPLADDPDFKTKNKMNNALRQQLNSFRTQFKKDSFAYVSDNPDVIRAFEARNVAANDGSTKIQPAQLQSIAPFAVSIDKERMMGANNQQVSVMRKDTAAGIVAKIQSQPDAKSKMKIVNDVFDAYGKDKTIAGRDLKKAGIPQNILDIANLDKIPTAKALLPIILQSIDQSQAIQDRLKEKGGVGESFSDFKRIASTSTALTALFNTLPNTSTSEEQKSSMVNLTATAAAGDFLSTNGHDDVNGAVKKMADAIYSSKYSGFLKEARIPINVSMDNAKDAMFATEKDIKNMNFLPLKRDSSGVKLTKGEIMQDDMDSIQAGHWRTLGDDSGVYWVDSSGLFTPMVLEKGGSHRLEIHWDDLKDPTSELHTLMAKHPRKRFGLF